MEHEGLSGAARTLEEAFFAKENARLLAELRQQSEHTARREALRAAIQVDDEALVDHLLELGLCPETVLAVNLVPLAMVAWADGSIQDKERETILKVAADKGVEPGSLSARLLESWLHEKPGPPLVEAWKRYVEAIWGSLTQQERIEVREVGLGRARAVAEAAGGFLGLTSKISSAEQAVLDDLERVVR